MKVYVAKEHPICDDAGFNNIVSESQYFKTRLVITDVLSVSHVDDDMLIMIEDGPFSIPKEAIVSINL